MPGSAGRFQVFAVVESTRRRQWRVILKTDVDSNDMRAESWVPVYPGADWHEREAWEMYGFVFDGHPSLRHLYSAVASSRATRCARTSRCSHAK